MKQLVLLNKQSLIIFKKAMFQSKVFSIVFITRLPLRLKEDINNLLQQLFLKLQLLKKNILHIILNKSFMKNNYKAD